MQLANRNPVVCFNAPFPPVLSLRSLSSLPALHSNHTAEDGPTLYSNQIAKEGLKPLRAVSAHVLLFAPRPYSYSYSHSYSISNHPQSPRLNHSTVQGLNGSAAGSWCFLVAIRPLPNSRVVRVFRLPSIAVWLRRTGGFQSSVTPATDRNVTVTVCDRWV